MCGRRRNLHLTVTAAMGMATLVPASHASAVAHQSNSRTAAEAGVQQLPRNCPNPDYSDTADVIVMGDSYSSGEGLDCYHQGTDLPDVNECHRSAYAFGVNIYLDRPVKSVACSGATIEDLIAGKWGEPGQLSAVRLTATDVTLTIGGNDVNFAKILERCLQAKATVTDAPVFLFGSARCRQLREEARLEIRERLKPQLKVLYRDILRRGGRHTKLVVLTYPQIFPNDFPGDAFCRVSRFFYQGALGYSGGLVNDLATLQHELNALIRTSVHEMQDDDPRIRLADFNSQQSDHPVSCGRRHQPDPFVNGLMFHLQFLPRVEECVAIVLETDEPCDYDAFDAAVSKASFHPRRHGQEAMTTSAAVALSSGIPLDFTMLMPPPDAVKRAPYSWLIRVVGGSGTVTVGLQTGQLPPGLTINRRGLISGIPAEHGAYTFRLRVTDGHTVASRLFRIEVRRSALIYRGSVVRSPEGELVYVDTSGWRHAVASRQISDCHDNAPEAVDAVMWQAVQQLRAGEDAACMTAASGDIVKHPDGDSYVLYSTAEGLRRRWLPDAATYHCHAAMGRRIVTVARYHLETMLTPGRDLPHLVCIVRGTGGDAHQINDDGRREWIPDAPTFDCEVGRGVRVYDVSAAFIDAIPETGWHYCLYRPNFHRKIIRHSVDRDASYVHPDNTRTWIPDAPTWQCRMNQGVEVVDTRWREYIDAFESKGWDYCFDLNVFKDRIIRHAVDLDASYVHPDGTRTWIPDVVTWDCRMRAGVQVVDTRWREYIQNELRDTGWDYCYDVNVLENKIVRHAVDGDAHYVDESGRRHWIPDGGTYNCLAARGIPVVEVRWREYITNTPEGEWAVCSDRLAINQRLDRGQQIRSSDGRYRLIMQAGDGNLVLYNAAGRAIWATNRLGGDYTIVQSDGNIVVYRYGGGSVWASNTGGSGGNTLILQNDGNLVLYAAMGAVWASNTAGR